MVQKRANPLKLGKMLQNDNIGYLAAQSGFDTAENGPSKAWVTGIPLHQYIGVPVYRYSGTSVARTGKT